MPPLESYFCTMQEATSDDSESVDVQPSFHRDVSKYTMRRMACEHEAVSEVHVLYVTYNMIARNMRVL